MEFMYLVDTSHLGVYIYALWNAGFIYSTFNNLFFRLMFIYLKGTMYINYYA